MKMNIKKKLKAIDPLKLYELAGVIAAELLEHGLGIDDIDSFLDDEEKMSCLFNFESVPDETATGLWQRDALIIRLRQLTVAEQCTAYLDKKYPIERNDEI